MSLLKLPEIKASTVSRVQFDARPDALERWEPEIKAATSDEATISIYDPIGWSCDGEGVTAKRVAAALRAIGDRDVTVNINSPGGDFFEGVTIYNLLREHPHKVTVKIMGLAASAASVIAMSGDDVRMTDGSFLMIHNAWAIAIGNRHDMREAADWLEPFDAAMAEVYAARSGLDTTEVAAMMDRETWMGVDDAIENGFATGRIGGEQVTRDTQASSQTKHLAIVEAAMAKAGYTRSKRRDVLKSLFSGKPGAAENTVMPSADPAVTAQLQSLIQTMKGA